MVKGSVHLGAVAIFGDNDGTPECFFLGEGGVRSIDIVEEREKVMCFPESILVDFFLV